MGAFGSSLAELDSATLTNEVSVKGEVNGVENEKLRKMKLAKVKMEKMDQNGGNPQRQS